MKRFALIGLVATLVIARFSIGQPTKREVDEANAIVAKWQKEARRDLEKTDLIVAQMARETVDPVVVPDKPPVMKFKTGARRTPLAKIMRELAAGRVAVHVASAKIPASVAMVPKTLSMLGNDQYGDCVTAESCFAIEAYSVYVGLPEIVITDAAAIAWARAHGGLNGADLLTVIQQMEADGIKDSTGTLRKAGVPSSVDYTNATTLQSAVAVGPVSIAIGSGDLPSGAGDVNGWYALTSAGAPNDHNVDLCGFGKAEVLYAALNMPCPTACAGKTGYLCYTWSTIGFVTQAWVAGTVEEAWVRTPTTVGMQPPSPTQIIVTQANVSGQLGQPVIITGTLASGGKAPYTFAYTYGDGASDATGRHAYAAVGSYTVTISATDSLQATGTGTCTATISTNLPPGPYQTINIAAPGDFWLVPVPQTDTDKVQLIRTMFQVSGMKGFLPPLVPTPMDNDARWAKQEAINKEILDTLKELKALTPKKP